jgi:hypothetical protein
MVNYLVNRVQKLVPWAFPLGILGTKLLDWLFHYKHRYDLHVPYIYMIIHPFLHFFSFHLLKLLLIYIFICCLSLFMLIRRLFRLPCRTWQSEVGVRTIIYIYIYRYLDI